MFFFHFITLTIVMNSFLKFFTQVKNNKQLKALHSQIVDNRAKMLKAVCFKSDITHVVLIKMVSLLGRVGISVFSSCYHSVYNCISYNKRGYVFLKVYFILLYFMSVNGP